MPAARLRRPDDNSSPPGRLRGAGRRIVGRPRRGPLGERSVADSPGRPARPSKTNLRSTPAVLRTRSGRYAHVMPDPNGEPDLWRMFWQVVAGVAIVVALWLLGLW